MAPRNFRYIAGMALLLAACLLFGCAGPVVEDTPPYIPQPGGTATDVPQVEAGQSVTLNVILPAEKELLGQALTAMAEEDGNTVKLQLAAMGSGYAGAIKEAMGSEAPPDIFWLEGDADVATHFEAGDFFELSGQNADAATRGLAGMVPASSRIIDETKVYGLPLGYYAEGYLCNLDLMAALLSAPSKATLLEDLHACTWQQWELLVRMMEEYLVRPGKIQIMLGKTMYTMASYRPGLAQPLRGVFAVPTGDAGALLGNALPAVFNAGFASAADFAAADVDTRSAVMRPALSSLQGLLELETLHMTQKTGPLRRGEGYAEQETVDHREAAELFCDGTALFMRADTRTAMALEAEYPQLSGSLAMLPLKFPPPNYQLLEGDGTGAEDDSAAEDGEVAAQSATELRVAESIQENNDVLLYTSDGVLCLSATSPHAAAAQSLLLRLYTTAQGQNTLQSTLALYPFSVPNPSSPLLRQVSASVNADGRSLVVQPSTLERAQAAVGVYLQGNLLTVYEWGQAEKNGFLTSASAALGLRYIAEPSFVPDPPVSSAQSGDSSSSGTASGSASGAASSPASQPPASSSSATGQDDGNTGLPGALPG